MKAKPESSQIHPKSNQINSNQTKIIVNESQKPESSQIQPKSSQINRNPNSQPKPKPSRPKPEPAEARRQPAPKSGDFHSTAPTASVRRLDSLQGPCQGGPQREEKGYKTMMSRKNPTKNLY